MSWAKLLKPKIETAELAPETEAFSSPPEVEPEQAPPTNGPNFDQKINQWTGEINRENAPDEENPFALTDEEANAISAAQDLITTDPEKIKTVTQIRDPAAYALAHMQIAWERQEGATDLAALDEALVSNLAMFECARSGDDNRAKLFAKAIQAITTQEFELEKSTGSKLLGQKG